MQIELRVIGSRLYQAISNSSEKKDWVIPRVFNEHSFEWKIAYKSRNIVAEDLLSFFDFPSVLLLDVESQASIDWIKSLRREADAFAKKNMEARLVHSPVIAVLPSAETLTDIADFPDFVSDWVLSPVVVPELTRRVVNALKRKGVIKTRLKFGMLALIPESRLVVYEDRESRLSPSEFTLLEFFVNHMGTVISFKDLMLFFKSAGKSAEPNNIRVAIFQLRLKLEILTKSQIQLVSIHKQGYCLRQKTVRSMPDISKTIHVPQRAFG